MPTIVFGGAFDPPHKIHVQMLKAAASQLSAEAVVIVPTYQPPHKSEGFLSYDDRRALINEAFKDAGAPMIIDDIENERKKNNYSAFILPELKRKYGDIVYLIGGDSLERLDSWYLPEKIIGCCPIAVCEREGYENVDKSIRKLKAKYGGEFIKIDYTGGSVSSSVLKAKLLLGMETEELDASVRVYIERNGLFKEYSETIRKLRALESDELFSHSAQVVLKAVCLNSKHNLKQDYNKVFLAALLHDNAKERLSIDGLDVPLESIGTPVLHQFLGAEKARRDFGVTDEDILSAIRYHTTARAGMSMLEKLIYTADSVSDDRDYEPIPSLRQKAEENFKEGFKSVLTYTYLKLMTKGKPVYPLTLEAAKYYLSDSDTV